MPALAILNPRGARRRKVSRTGARRRRKMTAKQLRYFGPRKSKGHKKKRAAKSKVIIVSANPKGPSMAKKRRKHRRHRKAKFLSNPRSKRRRFFRNPRVPGAGFLTNSLVPAAIGAGGAMAVDLLLGNFPMPPMLVRGPMLPLTRIGLSFLIGAGGAAIWGEEVGTELAAGGMITTLYGLGRNFMASRMPGMGMSRYVPLNGMGRYVALNGMGAGRRMRRFGMNGMQPGSPPSMYGRPTGGNLGRMGKLGYVNPARTMNAGQMQASARYLSN